MNDHLCGPVCCLQVQSESRDVFPISLLSPSFLFCPPSLSPSLFPLRLLNFLFSPLEDVLRLFPPFLVSCRDAWTLLLHILYYVFKRALLPVRPADVNQRSLNNLMWQSCPRLPFFGKRSCVFPMWSLSVNAPGLQPPALLPLHPVTLTQFILT